MKLFRPSRSFTSTPRGVIRGDGRSAALECARRPHARAAAAPTSVRDSSDVDEGPARRASRSEAATRGRFLRAGFTMIEMLAVILIMGIMASLVAMNWNSILPKAQLHSAVRVLSETLSGTRSEAIARNATFQIQYDLERQRYRKITPFRKEGGGLALVGEERGETSWTLLPSTVAFKSISVDGTKYTQGMVNVRFDALGSASGHTIVLVQKPYENLYTIDVQGLLGLIDYHEGEFSREPPKESDFK